MRSCTFNMRNLPQLKAIFASIVSQLSYIFFQSRKIMAILQVKIYFSIYYLPNPQILVSIDLRGRFLCLAFNNILLWSDILFGNLSARTMGEKYKVSSQVYNKNRWKDHLFSLKLIKFVICRLYFLKCNFDNGTLFDMMLEISFCEWVLFYCRLFIYFLIAKNDLICDLTCL